VSRPTLLRRDVGALWRNTGRFGGFRLLAVSSGNQESLTGLAVQVVIMLRLAKSTALKRWLSAQAIVDPDAKRLKSFTSMP
jgi:hypothetical protein